VSDGWEKCASHLLNHFLSYFNACYICADYDYFLPIIDNRGLNLDIFPWVSRLEDSINTTICFMHLNNVWPQVVSSLRIHAPPTPRMIWGVKQPILWPLTAIIFIHVRYASSVWYVLKGVAACRPAMIRGSTTPASRLIIEDILTHILLQVVIRLVVIFSFVAHCLLHLSVRKSDILSFNVN